MDENLVGYLLNALDDDTHQQVEAHLRTDVKAQHRLETLRQALGPLTADRDEITPPPGLAYRAIARVAEYRCRPLPEPAAAPSAAGLPLDYRWWRRADLLVAASILLVLGGLAFQGVGHLRDYHTRMACANNLRDFHLALTNYSNVNDGDFPGVPVRDGGGEANVNPRHNVAGIFAVQLREKGCLPDGASLRCPSHGTREVPVVTRQQLQDLPPEEFNRVASRLGGCYAYSLGYRGPTGEHMGLRRDPDEPDLNVDRLPIMADCPTILAGGGRGNSANHKGAQNVLHIGGNVRYCTSTNAGIEGDHIYLNKDGKVAAGVNRWDTVLGSSGDTP